MQEVVFEDQARLFSTSVTLRDGRKLQLRPIRPDDVDRIIALFSRLSWYTIYSRFQHVKTEMTREQAIKMSSVDFIDEFAIVGVIGEGDEERIIAMATYYRLPKEDTAEVAFMVEDAYQGLGVGSALLEQMAAVARAKNIRCLQADVDVENKRMLQMFEQSGFKLTQEVTQNVHRVALDITPTEESEERASERHQAASIASLRRFLEPRSIAVIGATARPGSIGNILYHNLLHDGYNGVLYPVNPALRVLGSARAYSSVLAIPEEVDLAIIIVPAKGVHEIVQQCGKKGVRGLVIITAGFGESGAEGQAMQDQILETAHRYGMRIVGPNCMGVINSDPKVSMNGTFSRVFPPAGDIAFVTQSGALGLAILEYAKDFNAGLSSFVSIGNRMDVDSNDLLQYWEQDANTNVILLYMESFGNARQFTRIARRVAEKKPIVVVKSGRTSAGAKAAASHTGAMATGDIASGALFKQAGIVRVDTLEELFDVANLLSNQPKPKGRRVAILTNGGGPGIMTADACASNNLQVPDLSPETVSKLRGFLSPQASVANPIDMTAGGGAEDYRKALNVLVDDEGIDIVVVIFIPPIATEPEEMAAVIREVSAKFRAKGKVLVSSFMSQRGASLDLHSEDGYVPVFTFPESAALALRRVCDYTDWLRKPKGDIPEFADIDKPKAQSVITRALESNGAGSAWLTPTEVEEVLQSYGIAMVPSVKATTADQAGVEASKLGYPAAVKLWSDTITHKSDVGGVMLDLRSEAEVFRAFYRMKERLAAIGRESEMQGVVVQKMVTKGVETIVGVKQDRSFGPLILFGTGGTEAELFNDIAVRISPLTDADASELIQSVRANKMLAGWRGAPPADTAAVKELLLRVSAMVEDLPQISELDLNPVKVQEAGKGYWVVDARILVSPA